jgi:hypothetical protein
VENEAWDGSIERTVKVIDVIGKDDMEDEVVQTPILSHCAVPSIPGTVTQIPTQTTPVRFVGLQSTPSAQQIPASSPYLASGHLRFLLFQNTTEQLFLRTPFIKAHTPCSITACVYTLADPRQPACTYKSMKKGKLLTEHPTLG